MIDSCIIYNTTDIWFWETQFSGLHAKLLANCRYGTVIGFLVTFVLLVHLQGWLPPTQTLRGNAPPWSSKIVVAVAAANQAAAVAGKLLQSMV